MFIFKNTKKSIVKNAEKNHKIFYSDLHIV